jgi:signal transduction histidine kinase
MVAELATIGQSSLDLAEVLPASFALLESALDLDGLALLDSGSRPTFVWHNAPGALDPAQPPHAPIAAGTCVDVPLARGGRTLGVLRVRPGRELDEVDLRTLAAAAESLSSTIANAEAYSNQRAMIARMRSLDNLKTVFVATASHELRTPVAAVVGYANMLTESWDSLDSDTGLLYAQRVESSAQRLGALVENLLDFARLEQGRTLTGEKEPLDLGSEVQSLVEAQPDLAPDHEVVVAVKRGLVVSGSKLAIERVVANLIGNAAKYSPPGSTIRVRVEGVDTAHLLVDDEGPGVPAHEREQIFSRFFRGAGDAVTRTRGAGLGLSIVTEFATFMGGAVSIGTAPGGGTRFEVTYPLHEPEAVAPPQEQGETDDPA